MKKVMNNYKVMAIALATVFTLGITNVTRANISTKELPTELKYLGIFSNYPVFQLNVNNSEFNEYVITIKDAYHNVLFTEKLRGEKISRRYKLDAEEVDIIAGTTFEVTNRKTNATTVYKISNNTSVVQNVTVAKL